MLKSTVFFVFLWTLQATFAEETCDNSCSCKFNDGTYVDLSAIGKKDGTPRFFMLVESAENVNLLYSYNPCYPFHYHDEYFEVAEHACSGAAACIITPGDSSGSPPTQRAIGYQNSAKFFLDNSGSMKINYSVPGDEKLLTVSLMCNSTVLHELQIYNETSFVLSTLCACKNASEVYKEECQIASQPSKSGLSTGSILLITFFVILLVYVGFGILFNFCKGAHGTELLPNYEFWNELPKLIVDGFLFTCSCFGRRSSYADV